MKANICKKYLKQIIHNYAIPVTDNDLIGSLKKYYDMVDWSQEELNKSSINLIKELNITCYIECPTCKIPIKFYYPAEKFVNVDKTLTRSGSGYIISSINRYICCANCFVTNWQIFTTNNLYNNTGYTNVNYFFTTRVF